MTRKEFKDFIFEDLRFCGCGNPVETLEYVHSVLEIINKDFDERWQSLRDFLPEEDGLFYFVLYNLDGAGLTEHGTSIGGGWLTPKGEEVLEAMREYDFEFIFDHYFPEDGDRS